MVRFQCPTCGKALKAEPSLIGLRTRCTRCQTAFTVPYVQASSELVLSSSEPAPLNRSRAGLVAALGVLGSVLVIVVAVAIAVRLSSSDAKRLSSPELAQEKQTGSKPGEPNDPMGQKPPTDEAKAQSRPVLQMPESSPAKEGPKEAPERFDFDKAKERLEARERKRMEQPGPEDKRRPEQMSEPPVVVKLPPKENS